MLPENPDKIEQEYSGHTQPTSKEIKPKKVEVGWFCGEPNCTICTKKVTLKEFETYLSPMGITE